MKHTRYLPHKSLRNLACALGVTALMHATGVFAASGTWNTTVSGGNWNDGGNWVGSNIAGGVDATADFNQLSITVNQVVHYNLTGTIGNIIFGDTSPGQGWTLDNNGSALNILTLATTAGTPTITTNSGSNNISVELAGTQGLTKLGSGTLVLSANNSYTGTTTVSGGLLRIGAGGATGSVAGDILNSSTLAFNRSDAYTFSNVISGGGGRVVFGSTGTTILTAANTYTSINDISGGATLRGSDSTAYSGDATTKTVFGTGASVIAATGNSKLELRANGQNDATSQTLTMTTKTLQYSGGGGTIGIDVNREGGTGTGKSIRIGGLSIAATSAATTVIDVTGGNGYSLVATTLALGGAPVGSGTIRLNPTTASLQITGNVTHSSPASGVTKYLELAGTSSGNAIGGIISDGSVTAPTAITKSNTSTWTLNGVNTYTGATAVNAGTLLIGDSTHTSASLAAGSTVTVGSSGTLGGYGIINGATTVNGALNPGASAGKLTFNGGLTLAGTAVTTMEISGTSRGVAGGYDAVDLGASASLIYAGTLTLDISGIITDGTYDLFAFTNAPTGSFSSVLLAGSGGYTSPLSNSSGIWTASSGGKAFTFTQSTGDLLVTTVPEPGTMALLAVGGVVILSFRKRKTTSL